VALRTGISIIAGSSAALALGFMVSQWWARRRAHTSVPAKALSEPSSDMLVPVHVAPPIEDPDARLQDLDGGVSARPAEQWQDNTGAYDTVDLDDLGAMYLARAVQVPETDEFISDDDMDGLHIEVGDWESNDKERGSAPTPSVEGAEPSSEFGTRNT
jgi:hypothetical protein